jgi:flagellar motor switch protein FliM
MAGKRQLSQQEIDSVFSGLHAGNTSVEPKEKAAAFDFRRPDRLAKSQLRAIRVQHDIFVRNLASSLSTYLRAYVTVNLITVEQLSYGEFLGWLPTPTCIALLGVQPFSGNAVLELSFSLMYPILEILLGGSGKHTVQLKRDVTDIEKSLLDDLLRIILRDLKDSWRSLSNIDFSIESLESDSKFLEILALSEGVVAVAIEIRIGENTGMMNLAMPSIILKTLHQKTDPLWLTRKTESTIAEQTRMLNLIQTSKLTVEARIEGSTMRFADLVNLQEGDIINLDHPVSQAIAGRVNGKAMFEGRVASKGQRLAFVIDSRCA